MNESNPPSRLLAPVQTLSVGREDRQSLNVYSGRVFWFTGLSGAGKSTLAKALEVALHDQGLRTYTLDGENPSQGLNQDLDFGAADSAENISRVAEVAQLMLDAGLVSDMTGISGSNEVPVSPQLVVQTDHQSVEQIVAQLMSFCDVSTDDASHHKQEEG